MQFNQLNVVEAYAVTVAAMATALLTVTGFMSLLSGWPILARRYSAVEKPPGTRLWGQVISIGWLVDKRTTFLTVSKAGLYLSALFLFRFLRPPILIPWPDVKYVSARKILGSRIYVFDLGGVTRIRVWEKAFRVMEPFLVDVSVAESER